MVCLPQKRWADLRSEEISNHLTEWVWKHRLAKINVTPAPLEFDQNEGQDYIATLENVVFAARVRRWNTRYYFDDDFTIRSRNRYEVDTEWQKLLEGKHPPYYGIFLVGEDEHIRHGKLVDFTKVHDQLVSRPDLLAKALKSVRRNRSEVGKEFLTLRYDWFDNIVLDSF